MTETTATAHVAQPGNALTGEASTLRQASDVPHLVNNSDLPRSYARIATGIALGGHFLDAYDPGALIGGYLIDNIGQYRVFMANLFFFAFPALACTFAPGEYVLEGARFVVARLLASIYR